MATAPSQHRGQKSEHDWRAQLGAKLVAADEAVSHIKSGDRVCLSIAQQTPFELCPALAGRLMELENVVVNHGAAVMNWDLPGLGERFRLESMYLSPYDRPITIAAPRTSRPFSTIAPGTCRLRSTISTCT
jgi:hypothetical protein